MPSTTTIMMTTVDALVAYVVDLETRTYRSSAADQRWTRDRDGRYGATTTYAPVLKTRNGYTVIELGGDLLAAVDSIFAAQLTERGRWDRRLWKWYTLGGIVKRLGVAGLDATITAARMAALATAAKNRRNATRRAFASASREFFAALRLDRLDPLVGGYPDVIGLVTVDAAAAAQVTAVDAQLQAAVRVMLDGIEA